MPATQNVHVQMVNALLRVGAGVDDTAETGFRDPFAVGDQRSDAGDVAEKWLVFFVRNAVAGNMSSGNHQNVDWRLRIDVPNGHGLGIFKDDVRRHRARDDSAEKTTLHGPV